MNEPWSPNRPVVGVLHVEVAYDWGDEIDLVRAAQLAPSEEQDLARRPRTPSSIGYHPAPLRFPLAPVTVQLPGRRVAQAAVEATVFDFAGVNVRIDVALQHTPDELRRLAGDPAALQAIVRTARVAAEPLYRRLLPAIHDAQWQDFSEEYFVFHFDPATLPAPETLVGEHADWLASLLRLEDEPLGRDEIADALKQRLTYSPQDLTAVDWAAAVVVDRDCEETLRTIEFANLQLLEFRHIDRRLDDSLTRAYGMIHPSQKRTIPFFRSPASALRALGDIKMETDMLFERSGNALKLVGDQYLARVYRLAAQRFHLDEWATSIRHSLDVVEGVYQILSDQAAARRIEVMELIVIVLIAVEIVLSLVHHG
jgi:hypothetical protein